MEGGLMTQKIITLLIDVDNGEHAMQQVQDAAGKGAWRVVSLLDLRDTQGYLHWLPDQDKRRGRRVLIVLEEQHGESTDFEGKDVSLSEPVQN